MNARQLEKPGSYSGFNGGAVRAVRAVRHGRAMADMVARFDPKIVKMCGDGSKAED
jgi:hypothetical protein